MMNRRDFIAATGLAATAGLLTGFDTHLPKPKFRMGLQLFTIREAMAKDVKGTLQKAAAMGYQDMETYGFDPDNVSYYGIKAKDFSVLLQELKLTTSSGHYDLFKYLNVSEAVLLEYVDKCIEGALATQQKYITWPWLDPADRNIESFQRLADRLNIIGTHVSKAGLGFAYHNHDFEFVDHEGKTGYQVIMEETDADIVKLQMDLYWIARASAQPPLYYFNKQPGRFVMWHIKDMDKVNKDYTELGRGSIDYTKILPDYKLAGLEYYFLEQGGNFRTNNSMESIAESAAYFKKNLIRYL
ncbi:MAG: sugar phosphate isomerase/epimerase [Agriterribacter sp.]